MKPSRSSYNANKRDLFVNREFFGQMCPSCVSFGNIHNLQEVYLLSETVVTTYRRPL